MFEDLEKMFGVGEEDDSSLTPEQQKVRRDRAANLWGDIESTDATINERGILTEPDTAKHEMMLEISDEYRTIYEMYRSLGYVLHLLKPLQEGSTKDHLIKSGLNVKTLEEHVSSVCMGYFDDTHLGELALRFLEDLENLENVDPEQIHLDVKILYSSLLSTQQGLKKANSYLLSSEIHNSNKKS